MAKKPHAFAVGDRAAYSAGWCRSVGAHGRAQWRGTVRAVDDHGHGFVLATVAWDHGEVATVNVCNLIPRGRIAADAILAEG